VQAQIFLRAFAISFPYPGQIKHAGAHTKHTQKKIHIESHIDDAHIHSHIVQMWMEQYRRSITVEWIGQAFYAVRNKQISSSCVSSFFAFILFRLPLREGDA